MNKKSYSAPEAEILVVSFEKRFLEDSQPDDRSIESLRYDQNDPLRF